LKSALGKGLGALIPGGAGEVVELELDKISPGREQPRKVFHDESLKELAASIREKGVLQPLLVGRSEDGGFSLIAGERRFRAARLAGLRRVPVIVRQTDPEDSLEVALIENIQREDLGPIDTAEAFRRLMEEHGFTQEALADKVGKERATVANYLRLLKLPEEVKELINDGELGMGHARAVLAARGPEAQTALAGKIVSEGLSVRQAEALAREKPPAGGKKARKKKEDPHARDVEERLIASLGTKVRLRHSGKRGKIEIEYYSLEELDRLLEILL
jgi:ParB family chromosome partitioning protein